MWFHIPTHIHLHPFTFHIVQIGQAKLDCRSGIKQAQHRAASKDCSRRSRRPQQEARTSVEDTYMPVLHQSKLGVGRSGCKQKGKKGMYSVEEK